MSRPRCSELLLQPEPPPRLRTAAARNSVAWGGFLATRSPNAPSYPHFGSPNPPSPPQPGAGAGPFLPRPSPASPPSHPLRGASQSATAVPALDVGTPEQPTGAKRTRARSTRPREARLLHPWGTSPPVLAAVRSTPGQAGSCDASLGVRGRRRGLLGRSGAASPGCWHIKLPPSPTRTLPLRLCPLLS